MVYGWLMVYLWFMYGVVVFGGVFHGRNQGENYGKTMRKIVVKHGKTMFGDVWRSFYHGRNQEENVGEIAVDRWFISLLDS